MVSLEEIVHSEIRGKLWCVMVGRTIPIEGFDLTSEANLGLNVKITLDYVKEELEHNALFWVLIHHLQCLRFFQMNLGIPGCG